MIIKNIMQCYKLDKIDHKTMPYNNYPNNFT